MSRVYRITAVWAAQIADLLDARGRPGGQILKEVGLDRRRLSGTEARIPFPKFAALLDAAAGHLGDPEFGLHFGSNLDPKDAGAVAYVAANSADLAAATDNFITYLHTINEAISVRQDIGRDQTVLTLEVADPKVPHHRQSQEYFFGGALKLKRFLVGHRIFPLWVEFSHERDQNLDEIRRSFGCPVAFGKARNAMAFSAADRGLPCKNADPRLLEILKEHCEAQLASLKTHTDLKEQVKHLITQGLTAGNVSVKSVARDLGMSERSFARRLAEQGTSFGKLLNDVRCQLAKLYLADPGVRTNQIAYMLGYSEPAAFTAAFSRWTGQSPTLYREGVAV